MYLTQREALRYSADGGITSAAASTASHLAPWTPPPGGDISTAVEPLIAGIKRSTEGCLLLFYYLSVTPCLVALI